MVALSIEEMVELWPQHIRMDNYIWCSRWNNNQLQQLAVGSRPNQEHSPIAVDSLLQVCDDISNGVDDVGLGDSVFARTVRDFHNVNIVLTFYVNSMLTRTVENRSQRTPVEVWDFGLAIGHRPSRHRGRILGRADGTIARMVFGTSLRVAADGSQPLSRRVMNLVNAVEKFYVLGYHDTFAMLHLATGSTHGNWAPEQVDLAVKMLQHAHDSWSVYKANADRVAHEAKRQAGYLPPARDDTRESWRVEYFDANRRNLWRLHEVNPYLGLVLSTLDRAE
jgi:hypothetical protein